MSVNDSVILNYDHEDLIAGTMGKCIAIYGNLYEITFETGQTINVDCYELDMASNKMISPYENGEGSLKIEGNSMPGMACNHPGVSNRVLRRTIAMLKYISPRIRNLPCFFLAVML